MIAEDKKYLRPICINTQILFDTNI